ncbi:hypothetical protein K6119_18015 [Paracrocinitomix mangrovi]|uniref:hypothetical protein n=1 Tax=Paracrocinitomix mangrovi TaxID=2862509 RepID=UPI001C8EFD8D|nr:hypothetical protein [Paracrocinitomix mangrovi]UKN01621.1 hypothetical protein K6119_18015 [Paracrocinitomix mangrovi]
MMKTLKIGDATVQILKEYGNVNDSILFINVHEDETTSIETVYEYAKISPVHFVRLKHKETRRIDFNLRNKAYSIDPNRIFTKKGRRKTLRDGGKFSFKAAKSVKVFADSLLLHLNDVTVVIAMHNNTDVNYSIKSYLPGGDEAKNTDQVYVNPEMDPDDFIYTTELDFYLKLKDKNINVILQDNKRFVNDGSLSVYCGVNGIPYINIEAQKGHFEEQLELIKAVLSIL